MTDPADQNDPVAWTQAGHDYEAQGQNEDALRCYTRATEIDPDYLAAWLMKGFLSTRMGRTNDAGICNSRIREIWKTGPGTPADALGTVPVPSPDPALVAYMAALADSPPAGKIEYAGVWKRFAAYAIDMVLWGIGILLSAFFIVQVLIPIVLSTVPCSFNYSSFMCSFKAGWTFFMIFSYWIVFAVFESSPAMATWGKQLLKIHVTDAKGDCIPFRQALVRNIAKRFLCTVVILMIINAIVMYLSPRKKAIHDYLANTRVIRGGGRYTANAQPVAHSILIILGLVLACISIAAVWDLAGFGEHGCERFYDLPAPLPQALWVLVSPVPILVGTGFIPYLNQVPWLNGFHDAMVLGG